MSATNGHGANGHAPSGNGAGAATASSPGTPISLGRKDFMSDQEMRWCPGCGDYGITAALQLMLPDLGVPPHELVFVSGIGCAARLPYYMNTYGIHSIHGRAPAVATGVAMTRPDLSVWVIGGDGDMLSIGANHLLQALRRNVDLKILMFNNQIYGLTKGQYSPTSEIGKITKSTPFGSIDQPFNPVSVALGAEATFVARTHEADRAHMQEVFRRAHEHRGAAFVEVYQNCNVFNDGAFDDVMAKEHRADMMIPLRHGEPVRFGSEEQFGVFQNEYAELVVDRVADRGDTQLVVHDEHRPDPTLAFALSRLASGPHTPTPIGVFRDVDRPLYELEVAAQVDEAIGRQGRGDLAELIRSGPTWTVT
jgi:2-oxoglutarate ferredoxin oxidoreductase subunit beta